MQQPSSNRDVLTSQNAASFGSDFQKKVLAPGTVLYRLCGHRYRSTISDCWIDSDTFVTLIRKVQMAESSFERKSSSARKRNTIKNELALLDAWGNPLTHRQKIILKQDIIAYYGPIGSQSHYISANAFPRKGRLPLTDQSANQAMKQVEFRIGSHQQYVIPRFASKYRESLSDNPMFDGQAFQLFKSPKQKPRS